MPRFFFANWVFITAAGKEGGYLQIFGVWLSWKSSCRLNLIISGSFLFSKNLHLNELKWIFEKNNRNLLLTTSLSQFWFRLHPSSWPLSDNMVSIGWSVDLGKLETSRPQELATLAIKHRHFPHIQPETKPDFRRNKKKRKKHLQFI